MTQPLFAPGSPLENVMAQCERLAPTDATVLLLGETGSGKEVFARYVHDKSNRAAAPMIAVNCGAIPEQLLEAELFGHSKGAFTGADRARKGRIAMAEGGTLFLDEIGEMPLALQVKLLRLLQEKTYEPVGDANSVRANFRLIAATNRDLEKEVEAGRFRRDLYYRLCVCPVTLPPLRARPDDVEATFRRMWAARGEVRTIEDAVMEKLRAYAWPGNVRELENLVERLSICSIGDAIAASDLPPHIAVSGAPAPVLAPVIVAAPVVVREVRAPQAPPKPVAGAPLAPLSLAELLRDIEYSYIDAALAQTAGNRQAAAQLLGLQRTTLVEKLRRRDRTPVEVETRPAA